jgi:hypothetical protein
MPNIMSQANPIRKYPGIFLPLLQKASVSFVIGACKNLTSFLFLNWIAFALFNIAFRKTIQLLYARVLNYSII